MNRLKITHIKIETRRIEITYDIEGAWKKFFTHRIFFIEFNEDISQVPESVAIIPFMGNVLPVAWYADGMIELDNLDKEFYECLDDVKSGYINMYPEIRFKGRVVVKRLVENLHLNNDTTATFFSGGVDANYTFYNHISENPALMTVWGADVKFNDYTGWNIVEKNTKRLAEENNAPYYKIKSNFRDILDTSELGKDLNHPGWSWWHEFQHGIGLLTLAAPLAYIKRMKKIFIAASYTKDTFDLTCASDPTIDNYVRFCGCGIVHDGYDTNRQGKVHFLVNYSKEHKQDIPLRVCWITEGGENCCKCEKCCRTMTALYLEDADPKDFGFIVNREIGFKRISFKVKVKVKYAAQRDWDVLHNKFLEKYTLKTCPSYWRWFYKGGTYAVNHNVMFCIWKFWTKGYHWIGRICKKVR